jgi:nucleotide-binding universal stress UspA family protein
MSLKDILVHVDNSKHCKARIDSAIAVAAEHGASLTGVYGIDHPVVSPYFGTRLDSGFIEMQVKVGKNAAGTAEDLFRDSLRNSGVPHEWRAVEGQLIDVVIGIARFADIVIVGQHPSGNADTGAEDIPDRLVLSLGRPVVIMPSEGTFPVVGKRVVVAWDASRSATRAVHDALPFLERAQEVTVIGFDIADETLAGHGPNGGICQHLASHGISAIAENLQTHGGNVGEPLLSKIDDAHADLFIMGANGHARWREMVLGGTTRHLLDHMTVPVFMSH